MVLLLGVTFASAIAETAMGGTNNRAISRVTISALCAQQMLYYSSCVYQYSRCMSFVSQMRTKTSNDRYVVAFTAAMQKMRYQQVVISLTGLGEFVFFLYFIITLKLYWWLAAVTVLLDLFIYLTMSISFLPCFGKRSTKPKNLAGLAGAGTGGAESTKWGAGGSVTSQGSSRLLRNDESSRARGSAKLAETPRKSGGQEQQHGGSSTFLMVRASSHEDVEAMEPDQE
jgi:hypothetical protein